MSLLLFSNPLASVSSFLSSSSSSFSSLALPTSVSRIRFKPTDLHTKCSIIFGLQNPIPQSKTGAFIVNASSDIDGTTPPTESNEEVVPVDKLPLESKLQERMEQKMKMKLAKKIRLRRKRLVRKRRLRKKGRWPPSKIKKLKNV